MWRLGQRRAMNAAAKLATMVILLVQPSLAWCRCGACYATESAIHGQTPAESAPGDCCCQACATKPAESPAPTDDPSCQGAPGDCQCCARHDHVATYQPRHNDDHSTLSA